MTAPISWASSPAVRRSMLSNRPKGTTPELRLATEIRRRGVRCRGHTKVATDEGLVSVDFAFRRARLAVFVDGCYWHACPQHASWPKANAAWWKAKLEANVERDRRQRRALRRLGWKVIRVWTHEPAARAARRIERALIERGS